MVGRIVLCFILVPLVELALLNQVLNRAGFLPTLGLVFVTGIVGVNLARHQGQHAWKAIQQQMSSGQQPSKQILDGVMILLAGAFLITPGILTDVVGFSLLIPAIRTALGARLSKWFLSRAVVKFQQTTAGMAGSEPLADDDTAEQPSVRVVEPE